MSACQRAIVIIIDLANRVILSFLNLKVPMCEIFDGVFLPPVTGFILAVCPEWDRVLEPHRTRAKNHGPL
jgi:hypothetical protein